MNLQALGLEHFENRALSLSQAYKIADQMYDLGGKSKTQLIFALSGKPFDSTIKEEEISHRRFVAYTKLDPLTQIVCNLILTQEPLDEIAVHFGYIIKVLQGMKSALEGFEKAEA